VILTWQQLRIYYWMLTNPVKLFYKINTLEWYKNMLQTWIADLTLPTNAKVIDLGCASGSLTEYLAERGHRATGVDASEKMIAAAKSKFNHKATYQQADAKALPFSDGEFDVVISASLLNVVSEPECIVSEMVRICKPNGVISVLVPRHDMTDSKIKQLNQHSNGGGFSRAALLTWHQKAPKIRPGTLINWMQRAGLQILQQRDYLNGMVTTISVTKLGS